MLLMLYSETVVDNVVETETEKEYSVEVDFEVVKVVLGWEGYVRERD